MKSSLKKIKEELYSKIRTLPLPYKKKLYVPEEKNEYAVDISSISAYAIDHNLRDSGYEAFTTSIYEVNQILDEKYTEEAEEDDNEPTDVPD